MTQFPGVEWAAEDLQFKASSGQFNVDEAQGIVECFVAAVGNKDSVGDVVAPGAFDGSLRRRKPRVVWGHDWNQPIGKVLAIEEVGPGDPRLPQKMKSAGVGGLLARVQFNLRSERGKEAFASVAFFGEDQEWSIGYKTIKAEYDPGKQANVLQEVELFEVSPVLHGANQLTGTISVKSADEERIDSFQKSKWPMFDRSYAAQLKEQNPEIWSKGGNIKGNDQYEILTKIAEQGGKATTEDQIKALELREAWIARHHADFRLPGIIAQIKWLAIGSRGEDHMKKVIADAKKKRSMSRKGYEHGADEHEALEAIGPRRVMMRYWPDGSGAVRAGREEYGFHQAEDDGVYVQKHSGLGDALSATMRRPVQLQMVRDNFAIFSASDEMEGEEDFFISFHFDRDNNRYMFSQPFPVDVEVMVHFDSDEDGMKSDPSLFDMTMGFEDIEFKAIGTAIGGGGMRGNPNDAVDHDGDGMIFDGTPNEQRAPRRQRGPLGPAGPRGRNTQQTENARAVARLRNVQRTLNQRTNDPRQERRAGQQMRDVGRFLRAAGRADARRQDFTIYEDGSGNATTSDGRIIKVPGYDEPKRRERAIRQMDEPQRRQMARIDEALAERRGEREYNESQATGVAARRELAIRGDSIRRRLADPRQERRAGQEMRDVGRYLRAAERNERAARRTSGPMGPAGPQGDLANARAVNRLNRIRSSAQSQMRNERTERQGAQRMSDVGRYLRAAARNERRARQVGPAGPMGPMKAYDDAMLDYKYDPAAAAWEIDD